MKIETLFPFRAGMKRGLIASVSFALILAAGTIRAEDEPPTVKKPLATNVDEAKYTAAIEKRTADILAALELTDEVKSKKVHDSVILHYRALRDWQASHQDKLASLRISKEESAKSEIEAINDTRKIIHDQFFGRLEDLLTPEQVDIVKDKLTYNKVRITYNSYCQIVSNLTEAEKAKILELLKEAREVAVEGISSDEKTAIFTNYKGKINNYLSAQGHDVKQDFKAWGEKSHEKKPEPKSADAGAVSK